MNASASHHVRADVGPTDSPLRHPLLPLFLLVAILLAPLVWMGAIFVAASDDLDEVLHG